MPEVPTFAELGLAGFEDVPYYGLFAPTGTPRAAIDTCRPRWRACWPGRRCTTASAPWA
jgi:tripartite-type tricarboxylate transporter receptor subunit TctC